MSPVADAPNVDASILYAIWGVMRRNDSCQNEEEILRRTLDDGAICSVENGNLG